MSEIFLVLILVFFGQTVGALLGIIKKPTGLTTKASLAFAGSMMLGISFFELLPEALQIADCYLVFIGLLLGIFSMVLVDRALPHIHPQLCKTKKPNLKRCAAMLVIGIALHNLPEGLAIGIGFALTPSLGILIALGIAAQDIPENIATIVPLYGVIKKRTKSFLILVGTVLFELIGFGLGYFILRNVSQCILGFSLALAAGFMVYISIEELIPSAQIKRSPYIISLSIFLGFLTVLLMIFLLP